MAARRRRNSDGPDYDEIVNSSVSAFRRLDRSAQVVVLLALLIAGVVAGVLYYRGQHGQRAGVPGPVSAPSTAAAGRAITRDLLLGNADGAGEDAVNRDNCLM